MSTHYQKYIFKIKGHNIVSSKEVLIRNITQNPDILDVKDDCVFLNDKRLQVEITYSEKTKKPTGIIKVSSKNIEELELFDSKIVEIISNEKKFTEFRCIYDGISSHYSTTIYSKLHEIERRTREFLKELFYLSDDTAELKEYSNSLKEMEKNDFTFSKLINHIFKRDEISNEFISHIESCIEAGTVPKKDLLPTNFWNSSSLTGDKEEGLEINKLLEEIRKTRNIVAHCGEFSKEDFESCNNVVSKLSRKLDDVINSIESAKVSSKLYAKEAERINNSLQSVDSEIKKRYFKSYEIFEGDLRGQIQNFEIDWNKKPAISLKNHRDFYLHLSEKTDEEIKQEIERLNLINLIDGESKENNIESKLTDKDVDDLTIIVPAQEDGFKQVFLTDNEWYDIRIGKAKRNKIQYIAGYEVAPRSGIQYIAKVKKIVPSDNYVGYWKVLFDGKPQKYDRLIPLGDTYPPQNIRYTTKKELDDVAGGGGTLEVIFKNPY
ncbi:TPA: hypothetical protein U1265_001922 [Streptococcus suis]|uniref:hypothetical protein n=1 Tax=Streptococcus suis TaxID=1307 RepID=UPI0003FC1A60|nr:hypothetical protein [Streptococcus suis]HEM3173810.1 hypothetical protein [Streptococcus suis]HEM4059345.1 hypothetical protein [Streptococcus suis]HEM5098792.1 hypothetical protein [Streptococcus suis]HEM5100855.1 hypothetical protein [Streptococcus suis]HEM5108767.1 hypothetical protein [Streptococcus suis]